MAKTSRKKHTPEFISSIHVRGATSAALHALMREYVIAV